MRRRDIGQNYFTHLLPGCLSQIDARFTGRQSKKWNQKIRENLLASAPQKAGGSAGSIQDGFAYTFDFGGEDPNISSRPANTRHFFKNPGWILGIANHTIGKDKVKTISIKMQLTSVHLQK